MFLRFILLICAGVFFVNETGVGQLAELDQLSEDQLQQLATSMEVQPSQVKALLAREQTLWSEFLSLNGSQAGQMQFLKTTIQSLETGKAATAKMPLSDDFKTTFDSGVSQVDLPTARMARAGFLGLPVERLPEQRVLAGAVRRLTATSLNAILPLLQERSMMEPSPVDYIIYGNIRDGLAQNTETQSTGSAHELRKILPGAAGFKELAAAKNPVYRLLSIDLAPVVESNQSMLVIFNSEFITDPEPVIKVAAASALLNIKTPSARAAIEAFASEPEQSGNPKLDSDFKAILERSRNQGND